LEEGERPRSKLYIMEPLLRRLPEVEIPKRHVPFKEKFMWTGIVLLVFLVMTQIPLYGMIKEVEPFFGRLQYVLASHAGTIVELGIGPIVTAGIIMQLLAGSKLVNLDMSKPDDRALFTGVQKVLAVAVAIFEASMMVLGGHYGSIADLGVGRAVFLVAQLVLGSVIVLYLDELVSKFGFGSGISLFIAAGVTATIFWQAFNPIEALGFGAVPNFIRAVISGSSDQIYDAFFRQNLPNMMGFFAMIAVFFIVVYAESMRVEIPLAYGQYGGLRGRYPIKLLYTSVIPVILASMIFMNLRIFAGLLQRWGFPLLGTFDERGHPISGVVYYLNSPNGIQDVLADPLRAIVYLSVLILLCVGFSYLWIYMTGMGPKEVAEQLDRSGMLIPGFRRDIRVMESVLDRYIKAVTFISGAFIAVLSALADFTGAIGSGTGVLLTVSIIYGLYQEIAREQVVEMFPVMRRFLGE